MAERWSVEDDAPPTQPLAGSPWVYDAFVSYARFDERLGGFLTHFTDSAKTAFRALTGRDLRLFVDTQDIATSERSRDRLIEALDSSVAMIALLTPSYITSEWCNREWARFTAREAESGRRLDRPVREALVFPIALRPLDAIVDPTPQMLRIMQELAERQQISFQDVDPGSGLFQSLVTRLVTDLAMVLERARASQAANDIAPSVHRLKPEGLDRPYVTTYHGDDRFLALLAEAVSVTIIGTTNDGLADQIEAALMAKRHRQGNDAFWESLRVVFFADDLLPFVNDQLVTEFADPAYALRERAQRAGFAKRTVMSLLLREGPRGRWTLYSHSHLPPFLGAVFGMPDGSLVVQIRVPQPSSPETAALWLELEDRRDRYFSNAFNAVLETSREEHEVVLVGEPAGDGFRCTTARFRRGVMVTGQHHDDWLPAVIAMTWRQGPDGPQPLLQLNTPKTSTREIGKLSHPSGYINQQDHTGPEAPLDPMFELSPATAEAAVWRELRTEFGINPEGTSLVPFGTVDFYYPDKENLQFSLFSVELDAAHRFSSTLRMYPWTVDELLAVRHYQVLTKALVVAKAIELSTRQRTMAAEIVALNLVLHGEVALAARFRDGLHDEENVDDLVRTLERRTSELQVARHVAGTEVLIDGIAGLQFRAFFSHILPIYANIGSRRAVQVLEEVDRSVDSRDAATALSSSYDDEEVMTALPIDL